MELTYLRVPSDIGLPPRRVDLITREIATIDTHAVGGRGQLYTYLS